MGFGITVGLPREALQAQEAQVIFPVDPTAFVAEAKLGVGTETSEGLKTRSGVRNISGIGRIEAAIRFEDGEPVAIQPQAIAISFGRRTLEWSFRFELGQSVDGKSVSVVRRMGVRGLALSLVNESGFEWFPVDPSGTFLMDRLEFSVTGALIVEGSDIDRETTLLEDQWPIELDMAGVLESQNGQLSVGLDLSQTLSADESSTEADLKIEGTIRGSAPHPFAQRRLTIEWVRDASEVRVSWQPKGDLILWQDSTPEFSDPILRTISSDVQELRIPVEASRSIFFQTRQPEE